VCVASCAGWAMIPGVRVVMTWTFVTVLAMPVLTAVVREKAGVADGWALVTGWVLAGCAGPVMERGSPADVERAGKWGADAGVRSPGAGPGAAAGGSGAGDCTGMWALGGCIHPGYMAGSANTGHSLTFISLTQCY